jgi:hypothetical protein
VKNILSGDRLNVNLLNELLEKPEPFAPGEALFWDDPHISKGMLEAHFRLKLADSCG